MSRSAPRSAPRSNVALLTEGQSYIQRAKKARQDQVDEIKFDDAARSDWLTGFSKRKKAKHEEKKSRAIEREKKEHLESRRKARQELKERAKQNVKDVRAAMGLDEVVSSDDEDEDENAKAGPSKPRKHDVEYEDEDQLATVTITEDFDPSTLPIPGRTRSSTSPDPASAPLASEANTAAVKKIKLPEIPASSRRAFQKAKRAKEEKKVSRSMETKSERKLGKAMEAKRRSKKAGIAMERDGRRSGGKFVAKKGGKPSKRR